MGSYISVGFVFKNNKLNLKKQIFKNLLDKLGLEDYSIIIYKVCKDIDGKNWIEERVKFVNMTDNDYDLLINNHYGNLLMLCPLKDINNQMVNITIYKNESYFGFLLDLFDDIHRRNIDYEEIELALVDFVTSSGLPFDYAFCENEGEIEFPPEETNYSILITNDESQGLSITKGEYLIDGVTLRAK